MGSRERSRSYLGSKTKPHARARGPYIFFTLRGAAWIGLVFLILAFSLQRVDASLLLFALVLGALSFFAILITHDNAAGLKPHSVTWGPNLLTGTCEMTLHVSCKGQHTRERLTLSADWLDAAGAPRLVQQIPQIKPQSLTTNRLSAPLPWGNPHQSQLTLGRVLLESRYPFGLLRAWHVFKPTSPESWPLPPQPQPLPQWAKNLLAPSESDEDSEIELGPHTFQSPFRIDWRTSIRTGQRLVRDFRSRQAGPSGGKRTQRICWLSSDDTRLSYHQIRELNENQPSWIYTLALESLRHDEDFSLSKSAAAPPRFSSRGMTSSEALSSLLPLLWAWHRENAELGPHPKIAQHDAKGVRS